MVPEDLIDKVLALNPAQREELTKKILLSLPSEHFVADPAEAARLARMIRPLMSTPAAKEAWAATLAHVTRDL